MLAALLLTCVINLNIVRVQAKLVRQTLINLLAPRVARLANAIPQRYVPVRHPHVRLIQNLLTEFLVPVFQTEHVFPDFVLAEIANVMVMKIAQLAPLIVQDQ